MQKLSKARLDNCSRRIGTTVDGIAGRGSNSVEYFAYLLLVASAILFFSCGGTTPSSSQPNTSFSGNWQFSMTNPDTSYPLETAYGLQGGFVIQENGSVKGEVVYSISGTSQVNGSWTVCDSGGASINGTVNGQTLSFTATAGSQTFTFQGTLSSAQAAGGTFSTSGGTVSGFSSCGLAASSQAWTAVAVPPLSGSITGSFHSGGSGAPVAENNQNFPVTGVLTQGENVGASSATVTGTLSFLDPVTAKSDYPCIPAGTIYVNGEISGNKVVLQLIGVNGAAAGQIGVPLSQVNLGGNGRAPVTFDSTTGGYVLHSTGVGYVVNTSSCSSSSNLEDVGFVCLALNSSTACQQPITLSPASVSFAPQLLGSTGSSSQTITLANNSSGDVDNLTLTWLPASDGPNSDTGQTDFTNMSDFLEADNCVSGGEVLPANTTSSTFSLATGQACTIRVAFAPQASCTWLPGVFGGAAPSVCPLALTAQVVVDYPSSATSNDLLCPLSTSDCRFAVPIVGRGLSFVQPSTPELDFSAEAFGEASLPQALSFTNTGTTPVQVLPYAACTMPATGGQVPLTHPLVYPPGPPSGEFPVVAAGLQVVASLIQDVNQSTILYNCDFDPNTRLANFQISSDSCSGALLVPQQSCSLEITFVPQSTATYFSNLDYFLELNTVQCTDPVNDPPSLGNPCELDGGRFPVELKANIISPLRMSPAAGLDFGAVSVGKSSPTQSVTLLNDPNLSPQVTVKFPGKVLVSGNYSETDNCPFSLAAGASCTLVITFKPSSSGHNPGTLGITYAAAGISGTQTVYLRGTGQ